MFARFLLRCCFAPYTLETLSCVFFFAFSPVEMLEAVTFLFSPLALPRLCEPFGFCAARARASIFLFV